MKIGHGYDAHRLVTGRKLILGGVDIPFGKGLDGHSDADALTHAVMDALLGAAGLPDIGVLFPNNDDAYLNICSLRLLEKVAVLLAEKGYKVVNIDCTVVAQAPKIIPFIAKMRENIANSLGIGIDLVNIKATTEEKMGFTGSGEGICAHCVCLIENI